MDYQPIDYHISPPTVECVQTVSRAFDIPPLLLASIIKVEGGKPGMKKANKNGTFDHGIMQVNTVWLGTLSKKGISANMLANNSCVNIAVGGWILSGHKKKAGDWWTAVGWYHSKTPTQAQIYRNRVKNKMQEIASNL